MIRPPLEIRFAEHGNDFEFVINGKPFIDVSEADLRECLRVVIEKAQRPTLYYLLQEAVRVMGKFEISYKGDDAVDIYTLEL